MSDGTIYTTDSESGTLFRKKPDQKMLTAIGADGALRGACDGLYWHDGTLVGIQNGTNPGRVIRIALAEKGTGISGVTTLQSHHHSEFAEPTTGAIAGGALYAIANSYVGHFQSNGCIKDPDQLKPTAIIAIPLKSPP